MKRFDNNPILEPVPGHYWQNRNVYNAAVLRAGDKTHIFYRAQGDDNVSRIGYASSADGYSIDNRDPEPVFIPEMSCENLGCEDPRLIQMGKECFMTYTKKTCRCFLLPTPCCMLCISRTMTYSCKLKRIHYSRNCDPYSILSTKPCPRSLHRIKTMLQCKSLLAMWTSMLLWLFRLSTALKRRLIFPQAPRSTPYGTSSQMRKWRKCRSFH